MKTRTLLIALMFGIVGLALPEGAAAHRLDEYLQASRISVERDAIELEIDLTPGMNVASQIFASIDTNGDGHISSVESDAYARLVFDSIALNADGRPLRVSLLDQRFPEFHEMALGVGTIRLRATAALSSAAAGRHHVYYRNTHQPEIGVYLVNALLPEDKQIEITQQRRDYAQHELSVEYRVIADSRLWWVVAGLAMVGVLGVSRGRKKNLTNAQFSLTDSRPMRIG